MYPYLEVRYIEKLGDVLSWLEWSISRDLSFPQDQFFTAPENFPCILSLPIIIQFYKTECTLEFMLRKKCEIFDEMSMPCMWYS